MSVLKPERHHSAKEPTYRRVGSRDVQQETIGSMTLSNVIALGLSATLLASAAAAQTGGATPVRTACAADFQKACPEAKPGPGGGMGQCARAHFKEFTQPCQSAIQAMRARMHAAKAASNSAVPATNSP
jgi:hypothetical protein